MVWIMIRFFDPENKFWQFMNKITDVACMSLLWALFSLPIITMGAATAAFYEFTLNQVKETEGKVIRSFCSSFRRHFKKATLLWMLELLGFAFFSVDLWAAWSFLTVRGGFFGSLVLGICLLLAVLFTACFYYVYPLVAFYDFPIRKILGNSFIMAVGNLPVTLTLVLMTGVQAVLFYYLSGLYFFWQGLFIFFSSYFILGLFLKYTEKEQEEPKQENIGDDEKWLV